MELQVDTSFAFRSNDSLCFKLFEDQLERTIIYLTADHAGAENPNYLKDNKYNVKNIPLKDIVSIKNIPNETLVLI
jgi:hypothetical protein